MKDPFVIQSDGRENKRIKGYTKKNWEGDHWPDSSPGDIPQTLGKTVSQKKLNIFFTILILGILALVGRAFFLQIIQGRHFRELAEGNRIRIEEIRPDRGIIYAREGQPLVRNIPDFSLQLTPADLPEEEEEEIISKISQITGLSPDEIWQKINDPKLGDIFQPRVLKEHIDYAEALLLEIDTAQMPGVLVAKEATREYLQSEANLAHVLGYTGRVAPEDLGKSGYLPTDRIGKTGIELTYEKVLRGVPGKKRIEVDRLGKEKKVIGSKLPQAGENLVLTIDLDLQEHLNQALEKNTRRAGSQRGSAIAMDPQSGQILALVSLPEYDNNEFSQGISQERLGEIINDPNKPLFFRAISGQYPPGSTIKPVIAGAALEEGIITPYTTINSVGGINIDDKWFYPDWKAGGHGLTDVIKAIAESVNTFFYYVGGGYKNFKGLGLEKITEYAGYFGLGKTLGIDLPGEKEGFLPSRQWKEETKGERWYIGDTYHLAIGQGEILVTPLQVASFTAAIANRGKIFRPHLVKEVVSPQRPDLSENVTARRPKADEAISDSSDQIASLLLVARNDSKTVSLKGSDFLIRSDFIKPEHLEIVRRGMRKAVLTGSAQTLNTLAVEVAGKTGTAESSKKKKPHAWFTCFAPYKEPEIVITILVENGGQGHKTALPVAKEVLEWYFMRSDLPESTP